MTQTRWDAVRFRHANSSIQRTDTASQTSRCWSYWLLTGVLVALFLWFQTYGAIKCRCYESVWHEAQARAGLVFVGIAFLRILTAAIFSGRHFNWLVCLVVSCMSPLWIWLVFGLVLSIRDAF